MTVSWAAVSTLVQPSCLAIACWERLRQASCSMADVQLEAAPTKFQIEGIVMGEDKNNG